MIPRNFPVYITLSASDTFPMTYILVYKSPIHAFQYYLVSGRYETLDVDDLYILSGGRLFSIAPLPSVLFFKMVNFECPMITCN